MSVTALKRGKKRYQQQRRRDAIRRVKAYKAWLRAGCPFGPNVPALPYSSDFRAAREAGL
jgi:hypothetical protein